MRVKCAYSMLVKQNRKKERSRSQNTVTVNLTCPILLYKSGELEWQKRGYKGAADVFQTALRKMTGLEFNM